MPTATGGGWAQIAMVPLVNGIGEGWFPNEEGAIGTGVGITVVLRDFCRGGSEMEAAAKETESGAT